MEDRRHRLARRPLPLDCPSAQPEWKGSAAFGVVGGTVAQPRVGYLEATVPITKDLLTRTAPVAPTEVLRFKAKCIESRCVHFKHRECTLVTRMLNALQPVVDELPACQIRGSCRWYHQAGGAACLRCPQVITSYAGANKEVSDLAASGDAP